MGYQVEFLAEAEAELARLDSTVRERIFRKLKWLSENFEAIAPEPLSGEFKGYFKLRIGDYRAIYSVRPKSNLVIIHLAGHRREIYK
jgi:mRNA interferase RelE/StbE